MKQIFVGIFLLSVGVIVQAAPSLSIGKGLPPLFIENEDDEQRIKLPPSPGNFSELQYLLWTRLNSGNNEYYVLEPLNLESLAASNFNGNLFTYVLHPGWTAGGQTGWVTDGKTSLLSMMDCNVISVDWALVVPGPNYFDDAEMMYQVAMSNAQLLDWLVAETGLTVDRIEITGHSLGAHSSGMTSHYMNSGRVARITGLDPAGPLFYNKTAETRLDKSQADFVDIIHSNGCPAYDGCYGIGQSLGHVDIFPNGGEHMPRCVLSSNSSGPHLLDISGCSHDKAVQYWAESVAYAADPAEKLDFMSWPCNDWNQFQAGNCTTCEQGCLSMGFNIDRTSTGSYYLSTRGRSPYAMGDDQGIN